MDESLRRLEIRLPANHPVFAISAGKRSQIIREWLDLGQRMAEIQELLQQGHTQNTQDKEVDKKEFLNYFG